MGWAAGFNAGSNMAQGWIDTYNSVKKQKTARDIQAEIDATEQKNYEQSYGVDRGSVRTGLSNQAQKAAVMGQQPSATGLTPEQIQAAVMGQQPSATGLTAEQMATPVQDPTANAAPTPQDYAPMSGLARAQLGADMYRRAGFLDEARALEKDAALLRAEERANERLGMEKTADARANERLDLEKAADKRSAQEFDKRLQVLGFEIGEAEAKANIRKAVDGFGNSGVSPAEYMASDEYQSLPLTQRNAVAASIAQMTKNEMDAANTFIASKIDGLQSDADLLAYINKEDTITAGTSYQIVPSEDGKSVTLRYVYDAGDNAGKDVTAPKQFDTEAQAANFLRQQAKDPATAATYYETVFSGIRTRAAAAAAAGEESRQFADAEIAKLSKEFLDPDGVWRSMQSSELANVKKSVFAPFAKYYTKEEFDAITGQLPDPKKTASGVAGSPTTNPSGPERAPNEAVVAAGRNLRQGLSNSLPGLIYRGQQYALEEGLPIVGDFGRGLFSTGE